MISAATALGLDREPGLLRGYGAIPVEIIDDILTTAHHTGARTRLRRLLVDPLDGRLVQMESTARCFTGTLRDFAIARDQQDRLLGGTIADIDHITGHRDHGPTTARQRPSPVPAHPPDQGPPRRHRPNLHPDPRPQLTHRRPGLPAHPRPRHLLDPPHRPHAPDRTTTRPRTRLRPTHRPTATRPRRPRPPPRLAVHARPHRRTPRASSTRAGSQSHRVGVLQGGASLVGGHVEIVGGLDQQAEVDELDVVAVVLHAGRAVQRRVQGVGIADGLDPVRR